MTDHWTKMTTCREAGKEFHSIADESENTEPENTTQAKETISANVPETGNVYPCSD